MSSSLFTDSGRDLLLVCPLCEEGLKRPSTLPCSHIFCESCIKAYFTGFSQNGNLSDVEVPCPVCREPIPQLEDTLSTALFFQRSQGYSSFVLQDLSRRSSRFATGIPSSQSARNTLHLPNTKLQLSPRPVTSRCLMDKTFQVRFCEPCQGKGEALKAASHWCVNCQEGLCAFCIDQHRSMKLLKDHDIVDIFSLKPEHVYDEEGTSACSLHTEKDLDLFCMDHACLVCVTCVALDHRKCGNVKDVEELDIEKDLGINIDKIVNEVEECIQYADSVIQFKDENRKKLVKEKRQILERLNAKVRQFKTVLDSMESKAAQQIEGVHQGEMDCWMNR